MLLDLNCALDPEDELLNRLERLPDPRRRRGIRHRQASIVAVAICACLAGARSFAAIGEWAADLPQEALGRLGCRWHPVQHRYLPPSEPTLRRALQAAEVELIDRELGGWLERRAGPGEAVAVDGKSLRGAVGEGGQKVHLLAALVHKEGVVLNQRQVDLKHNEITEFPPLLEPLELEGMVVTADAMHTQREHARFLVEDKRADYLFTVKANQPSLLAALQATPEESFPPPEVTIEKGHGRLERRTVQTSTAHIHEVDFPYVGQIFRIEREATNQRTGKVHHEIVHGLTSLEPEWAGPDRIGRLSRGQWEIENRLHWVRDVTYDEDRSQVRIGQGPRTMASLRNFSIGCLRLAGSRSIAQSLRYLSRSWRRILALLGL